MLKKNYLFLSLFLIALFVLTISCNTTEPTDELKPGRRDYTWTVDTLANIAPSNSYTELWGYDPQHVWVAGDSWDLDKDILFYNGTEWQSLPLPSEPPAPYPWALWGLDANNIWAAGYYFWKYDGAGFKYFKKYSVNGFTDLLTNDIYGVDINHLYAVGNAINDSSGKSSPFIMQYFNNQWDIKKITDLKGIFIIVRTSSSDPNTLFLLFYNNNLTRNNYYRILKYSNDSFTELHNNEANIHDVPWVTTLNVEVAFGWDRKVYTLMNGVPKLLYDFSSSIKSYSAFGGRNTKDLFFETTEGVGHYNGEDIRILYPLDKKFVIMKYLFFEKEVFMLYYDFESFKFYVLRGKLK